MGILIDDFAHGRNTTPLPTGLSTLTWKTKLADILPNDWDLMDPWASQKANLIDILSHVSGLSRSDLCSTHPCFPTCLLFLPSATTSRTIEMTVRATSRGTSGICALHSSFVNNFNTITW